MQRHCTTVSRSAIGIIALLISLSSAFAQGFVYTNNNPAAANTVNGFSVSGSGTLTPVVGSPFSTGGNGANAGFYAAGRINISIIGNFLFVANDGSSTISVFSINSTTGSLTPVTGSPFSTGGTAGTGIALTATSQFLLASNAGSSNISVFSINAVTGALTPVAGSPFAAGGAPRDICATPDGKFLIATFGLASSDIAVFSIGATGTLTSVTGSPFSGGTVGPAGIAINRNSTRAFIAYAINISTVVGVLDIAANGALSHVAGSPFTIGTGNNSNDVVLTPGEDFLFVSNQNNNVVTALSIAAGGSLSAVPGSPFANTGGSVPQGLAMNSTGSALYVWNDNSTVTAFTVAASGSLSPISGSPYTRATSGVRGGITYSLPTLDNILPVELTSFSAAAQRGGVSLSWRTGSEIQNAGFEVQRAESASDPRYRAIASYLSKPGLSGLGTSSTGKMYSLVDDDPSLKIGREYLYRLVDISTDGIRKEHAPITVKIAGADAEELDVSSVLRLNQVLPNPASTEMNILFSMRESGAATVELFSTDGRRVATLIDGRAFDAGEHQEMISVKSLNPGVYTLRLTVGTATRMRQFVVAR